MIDGGFKRSSLFAVGRINMILQDDDPREQQWYSSLVDAEILEMCWCIRFSSKANCTLE